MTKELEDAFRELLAAKDLRINTLVELNRLLEEKATVYKDINKLLRQRDLLTSKKPE